MADHNGENQNRASSSNRQILKVVGYAAAAAFCAVSVCANLRYGLSLGKNPMDKATYAIASVAADIFKMAAPLLALSLWERRFRILAVMGFVLWLGCVSWSMTSAAGFVLSSRGEAIADRAAEAATRHGWEAKVERAESQLATLGRHRPADVIKAELASVAVAPHIWRRSRQCADLALEESRLACAPVLGLRKELAAAEAAERLETQLVAGRAQLATVAVAGSVADPQASALAKLTGVDEATIRTYVALLLAALIEAGSALGFTLVSVATAHNPPPPAPRACAGSGQHGASARQRATHASATNSMTRRVQTGLVVGSANHVAARESSTGYRRQTGSGAARSIVAEPRAGFEGVAGREPACDQRGCARAVDTGAAQSGCDRSYPGTRGLHRFLPLGASHGHRTRHRDALRSGFLGKDRRSGRQKDEASRPRLL